jgi:Domain of unknown function (DUF1707)
MNGSTRPPREDQLRASDADRDRAVEVLTGAAAEGRLTLEEYSDRSGSALSARTQGELAALTADIPASPVRAEAGTAPEKMAAVLGNESRKGPWVVPPHLAVRSVLGDCHLELQDAIIRQRVTVIDATVRLGSLTILSSSSV